MTWTPEQQRQVAGVLLGTWTEVVGRWGREAVAAYLGELEARGILAEDVVAVLREPVASDFPPSAASVAAMVQRAARPTSEEAITLIVAALGVGMPRGEFATPGATQAAWARAAVDRAFELSPLVGSFVQAYGASRLGALGLDDPEWGTLRRRELRDAWERHVEATDVRVALAGGHGELRKVDPLAALRLVPPQGGAA